MVDLGSLNGSDSWSYQVSADGSAVVGSSYMDSGYHAFRWTQAGGMVDLGTLGGTNSEANGISADGSIVVGSSQTTGNVSWHAFLRTASGGMTDLGTLGGTYSYALGFSTDGSTVMGYAATAGNSASHAFRWTQADGMVDLNTLGGTYSEAYGSSSDGATIVGYAWITGDSATHAFRWTQAGGMQDLNTLLSDAGVNMTGITLLKAYAISANGKYIAGYGDFGDGNYHAYLVLYDDNYTPPGSSEPEPVAGITSGAAQIASAGELSDKRRSMVVQSRATANELLGMSRPIAKGSYAQAGAMFGSALTYISGQASLGNLTALGGLGWGAQDYGKVEQNNALTFAGALRYTFLEKARLHPYAELGGWATPEETLAFNRSYLNGSGMTTGQGSAEASSFAGYARGGLIWDVSGKDRLVGYGEFGKQYLSVSSYAEAYGPRNPFPAEVNGGLLFMNVAKLGGQWTREVGNAFLSPDGSATPISLTLAGAAAHSFDPHMSLSASLSGAGTVTTTSRADTWGEFGARASAQITKNLSLGLDVSAIAGPDPVGASVHGGASLSFGF